MKTFKEYLIEAAPAKIPANRGDVAEAILGAAITAKFINPQSPVTVNIINKLLDKTLSSKIYKTKVKRANLDIDNIEFRIGIPAKATQFLMNKETRHLVKDLYASVIAYTQQDRRINKIAQFIRNNKKVDQILVNSDGIGDQKGTKADIKLVINDKPRRSQLSLKVSGGDQFAQISGFEFTKQVSLWSNLGLNVNKFKKVYNAAIKEFDKSAKFQSRDDEGLAQQKQILKQAAAIIYKDAANQLNSKLGTDKKDIEFMKQFVEFIKSKATGGDPTIELLKLSKGTFHKIRFDNNFYRKIADRNFHAKFKATGDPIVQIFDTESNKVILQIRVKIEGASGTFQGQKVYKPYMRNYIEAKEELFNLI